MDRREFVLGMGAGALASAMGPTLAFAQHASHKAAGKVKAHKMGPELKAAVNAALDCIKTGSICLAHCNALLADGDQSMGSCQAGVMNMLAVCEALVKSGSYNNADQSLIKSLAKTCSDYCKACEKECEAHASHHAECKNCMNSCKDCAKACDKFVNA